MAYIELIGEVELPMAEQFVMGINKLDAYGVDQYNIVLNSNGGTAAQAYFMIDKMKRLDKPISIYASGEVSSAALLLLAHASEKKRYVADYTHGILHYGRYDLNAKVTKCCNLSRVYLKKLSDRSRLTVTEYINIIQEAEDCERLLTAKELKKFGIADKIGVPPWLLQASDSTIATIEIIQDDT